MDWVHCNQCYLQPGEDKKFYLTSCGHLFCDDCAMKAPERCKVCKQQCMLLVLTAPLKPDVAAYFAEPSEILQQRFKELVKLLEFQKGHRSKLLASYRHKIASLCEQMQDVTKKLDETCKRKAALEQEGRFLREENQALKEEIRAYKQFRPSPASEATNYRHQSGRPPPSPASEATNYRHQSGRPPPSYPGSAVSHRTVTSGIGTMTSGTGTMTPSMPITMNRLSLRGPPVGGRLGAIPGSRTGSCESDRAVMRPPCSQPPSNKRLTPKGSISNLSFQLASGSSSSQSVSSRFSGINVVTNPNYYSPNQLGSYNMNRGNQQAAPSNSSPSRRPIGLSVNYPLRSDLKKYLESG